MMMKIMVNNPTIHLTPPLIDAEHIKEKIICVRAHRERIFALHTEVINNQLICHNYGQGGAGWTFLFGCVQESLRRFEQQLIQHPQFKSKPICVIGAGCYGLLTAILLARKGYNVRIVAQEHGATLPSYKAAGFFFPRPRKTSTPQERALFELCGLESLTTYLDIINGKHPFIKSGAHLLPAYYSPDIDPGFAPYIERGLLPAPRSVTVDFGNGHTYDLIEYQALWIESTQLMQELMREALTLGIAIETHTVNAFQDLPEAIIFNCAGLGARQLTQDPRIVPVQGHLITLKNQPDMQTMRYMINVKVTMTNSDGSQRDELIYYAPKGEGIMGITFIRGQDSLTNNTHEFDRILQRCKEFFGSRS